jgi:hypothetical protein
MIIANIYSTSPIKVSEQFNVVDSMDKIIPNLPTLLIGFDYVNKHYPDFDILNFKISDGLYWTFKKTEKRDKHEEGLSFFIRKVYADSMKYIQYIFVDVIQFSDKQMYRIIKKIMSIEKKYLYYENNMLFIYGGDFIFGLDIQLLKYLELDTEKLKTKIKSNPSVFICNDKEYIKTVKGLGSEPHMIPYLFYLRD